MTTPKRTTKRKYRLSPENAIAIAVLLILFVLLFNTFCSLAKCGEVAPACASVKVRCQIPNGYATGSGTAIDPHYVITCEHVTNSTPENGRFEIFDYHKNRWLPATLAASQPGDGIDISILYIAEELNYVSLADGYDVGKQYGVEGYGFAGTDTLYARKGTLLNEHEAKLDIRYGDSGGGLFEGNKLIGVIWGSANPEGGANNAGGPANQINIYTNNVCNFTPLRTIGRALRNWCATGRLRPARPYFGITITQDRVQNGNCGPGGCPMPNLPQGTPGYNGGFDGGNISPNGNNPYFPNPEIDNSDAPKGQPPIAGDPVKPAKPQPTPQPNLEIKELKDEIGKLQQQIEAITEKINNLKPGENCEELAKKQEEMQQKLDELAKTKPASGTLPNGKFRIKVNPKGAA